MGINVTCVDINKEKISNLNKGIVPIYEPGLDEMVLRNTSERSFSAVGTPPDEDGSADLKYILEVARTRGKNMNKYLVVVTKSTVPVGTAKKVKVL